MTKSLNDVRAELKGVQLELESMDRRYERLWEGFVEAAQVLMKDLDEGEKSVDPVQRKLRT
jgi:hypothetical protein